MEAMTVLLQKLHSLAQLSNNNLLIEVNNENVVISVGESKYYTDIINTDTLSSALMHLSMGASLEQET